MKKRTHARTSPSLALGGHRFATAGKLAPLPSSSALRPPSAVPTADDRCEHERIEDPFVEAIAAAAARSTPTKYPRLQTLASLAHDHVTALHTGDFVARSRQRWQQRATGGATVESNGARARRVSRETAALVIQSAWRRSAAVRLRARLVRSIWQQHMELAAWLTCDREQLQVVFNTLTTTPTYPLTVTRQAMQSRLLPSRFATLRGAAVRLPALLLATWVVFTLGLRRHSRFLRCPAPTILRAVHIPIRRTCRLYHRLWRETTRLAARTIQCRVRSFLARCKYWQLLRAHRRVQAAVRLQSLYRAWVARRLVWRLRRRRAALRIQCLWRCHHARRRVQRQRISLVATRLYMIVETEAVRRASVTVVHHAARQIQRTFRGQRERAQLRVLVVQRHQQQQWHRNPTRGYRLFAQREYLQAAVYLERCFRQGFLYDDQAEESKRDDSHHQQQQQRRLASGSRLAYSFSDAPTPLGPALVRGGAQSRRLAHERRPASPSHNPSVHFIAPLDQQLRFWQTYALSHWFSFQSNGDPLHLRQARVGFETFLRLESSSSDTPPRSIRDDAETRMLRLHSRVGLVCCVYWSRNDTRHDDDSQALSLCIETLDELELLTMGLTTPAIVQKANGWRAQLLMISAALHLHEQDVDACYSQLQTLLTMAQRGECAALYEEADLLFLLAIVLLACHRGDMRGEAETHLRRCYQQVELWPGVGFYNGCMSSSEVVARLQREPVGSFLLHREGGDTANDGSASDRKLLLQVKLSDAPCKVSSLRIHHDAESGLYRVKKLAHFSVHELVQQLPRAAGLCWSLGVRCRVYVHALERKLPPYNRIRLARRALLLPWEQWRWRMSSTCAARHNECWGSLCQLFAVRLEASDAHDMAALVARDGLRVARDRALRADLFFTVGRVSSQLQRRVETTLAIKQAAIESARLHEIFHPNFKAIARAFSRGGGGGTGDSFAARLERVSKLERMCVKAWSLDSCSPSLRGRPFCEALLLQRIDDEVAQQSVADTFFLRSLLRAHMRAFLSSRVCESTHVELAFACVRRLFERFYDVSTSHTDTHGLRVCVDHVLSPHRHDEAPVGSHFSFHALLLTWHRMPFLVCFEMAEVFYRWPYMGCSTLVDVYESLYGRLRSGEPRNGAHAAYEELFLARLAFLYAQRASDVASVALADTSTPVALGRKAVEFMDELIAMRRLRGLGSSRTVTAKRIQWPTSSSLQFPFRFSLPELIFMRGFLWEHVSKWSRSGKAAHRNAWRDFDILHRELLARVVQEQEEEREASNRQQTKTKKLRGVRVFVGETVDVGVTDVLYSKPFVSVQCEHQMRTTQQPATWMNQLSPGWNEFVELDVASSKARLTVTVGNRSRRLRRQRHLAGGDQVLGSVQVYVEELLASSQQPRPQWYDLVYRDADGGGATRMGARPRIRLAFQLMMEAIPMPEAVATSRARQVRHLRGNWDVDHLKLHLHGDLRRFVGSSWIWRWFAHQWLSDKEFAISAWFLQRAIDLYSDESDPVVHALDLVDLAKCYRATMGSSWLEYARALLDKALTILQTTYMASGSSDLTLRKQLNELFSILDSGSDPQTPLANELAKRIPASSLWIAMPRRPAGGSEKDGGGTYYFNEDTCQRFCGVAGEPLVAVPLEWEADSPQLLTLRDPLQPRRVLVLTMEMKARVTFHCQQQRDLHERDPHQWVAVLNPRRQAIQFLSLSPSAAHDDGSAVVVTAEQPPTYAMLADECLVYYVLIVQDAFRSYQRRCHRQRRLRGLLQSAFALACERRAAETRLAQRAETARRRQLNCLYVMIERAAQLRAMDLFTSDPFVVVELVDGDGDIVAKGETSVKRNTLNPQWHEEFRLHYAFVDHERQQTREPRQTPTLRLRVLDRDIVRTHERADDEANEAVGKERETQDEEDAAKQRTHDFLGLVETTIESLVHGKCVTADLELRDEDGEIPTDEERGTLTVTVQWMHDIDIDNRIRRNAVKPMLLVRPRKQTRPKPPLSPAIHGLVASAAFARTELVTRMADIKTLLDPLVRLFKRWLVAQAAGRTAEEAKLMEQRLRAAMKAPQPFPEKYAAIVTSADKAREAIMAVLLAIDEPIRDWLESCENHAAEALTATLTAASDAIREGGDLVPSASAWEDGDEVVQAFPVHVGRVLALSETIVTWRRELLALLTTFFEPPVPAWEDTTAVAVVREQFAQIRATLANETSRPPTANASAGTVKPISASSASQGPVVPPAAAAGNPSQANAAVAKRMERIERERLKARQKRL